MASSRPQSADLYLSLLKKTLTRYELEGDWQYGEYRTHRSGLTGRVRTALVSLLEHRGLYLVGRSSIEPSLRDVGKDWPKHAETMIGLKRLDNIQACVEDVLEGDVPGDLVETGVWRGGACIFMRGILAAYGVHDRTVWLADSFQGLPKPDAASYPADTGDTFWTHDMLGVSLSDVKRNFKRYGLLDEQVRFLEGWFKDTLSSAPIPQIAVLRLDGDMYESTILALNALYPLLSEGGYLIVDDYGGVEGCRAAVEDYRSEHQISTPIQEIDWTGVYWKVDRQAT